ncbi:mersacidin/lichenicidin family type 2 lantibiotic [Corynebacterium sp. TAE3-ERU12]|uniref:mersacidin/lichenicidin family type 2 lantibiotic n=1 Tax=Corynebacterium sp. TAE3-ERU12 TaxID=2849491 RepID=UPI001C4445F2|nr:mersacidin/lichenicidin family type 2 lantibiotic [Corynebacterium sp. TAE3-ERU12]
MPVEDLANPDIARAWKDEADRASLTPEQKAVVPDDPAGIAELSEDELVAAFGGGTPLFAYWASAVTGAIAGASSVYITTR